MSNSIIRSALEGRLKTWANAQAPPIPIAFQNRPFTPPSQARYMRAFLLPAETRSDDVPGETRTYLGLFQVSICVPAGASPIPAEQLVAELETLFPMALRLAASGMTINVTKPPSAGSSMPETGLYVTPVSIQYRADTE